MVAKVVEVMVLAHHIGVLVVGHIVLVVPLATVEEQGGPHKAHQLIDPGVPGQGQVIGVVGYVHSRQPVEKREDQEGKQRALGPLQPHPAKQGCARQGQEKCWVGGLGVPALTQQLQEVFVEGVRGREGDIRWGL